LRLDQDALPDSASQQRETCTDETARCLVVERLDFKLGKPCAFEETLLTRPRRGQNADPAAGQTARDEPQHPGAGPVKPGQVVDDHQQRAIRRRLAEKSKRRVGHHQPVGRRALTEPQSNVERVTMRSGQPGELPEERQQGLVEPGETHPGLELHATGTQNPGPGYGSRIRHGIQEHGLAHAWLPEQEQGIPVHRRPIKKLPDQDQLSTTPDQGFGFSNATVQRAKLVQPRSVRLEVVPKGAYVFDSTRAANVVAHALPSVAP
jgi:hypothetical protein